jgi:hypothetical protein
MAMIAMAMNWFKRDAEEQKLIAAKSFVNVVSHIGSKDVSTPIDKKAWLFAHPSTIGTVPERPIPTPTSTLASKDIINGETKPATDAVLKRYIAQRDKKPSDYLVPAGVAAVGIIILWKSL